MFLFRKPVRSFLLGLLALSVFACQKDLAVDNLTPVGTSINVQNLVTLAETPIVLGYFPSWSETWVSAATISQSKLASLPSTVTHVFLAFAKPNLTYVKGSFNLAETGIEVPYDGNTLKLTVAAAKAKGIKVLLSVGGETYWHDASAYNIDYQQIKDLVDDIGFAGIDWDFEPNGSFQDIGNATNTARFIEFFNQSRALMPRSAGYLMACAPAGCGALGGLNNDDAASPYAYSNRNVVTGETDQYLYAFTDALHSIGLFGYSSTGHMIPVFNAVGSKIDIVAYQGYNIGAAPRRSLMYDSYAYYANIHGFKIAAGIHVGNEPWGPYYTFTIEKTQELAQYIKSGGAHSRQNKGDGIMMWQLFSVSTTNAAQNGVYYANIISEVFNGTVVATTPATPIVNQTTVTLGAAITGSVSATGSLLILKDGVQTATRAVSTGNWTYTPTATGSFSFKLSVNNVASAASQAVTVAPVIGSGSGNCGYAVYNPALSYPTAGTKVFYNGKIYESKWWINVGEIPDFTNQWGAWRFLQNCAGGDTGTTAPTAPTVAQTTVTLGAAITGSVSATGSLLILKDGVQVGTQAVSTGNWSYTPTVTGSFTFKLSVNGVASTPSLAVSVTPVGGNNGCGYVTYNPALTYPIAGTRVYHNGKIYQSKWWINVGEAPNDADQWGAWKFIQLCP